MSFGRSRIRGDRPAQQNFGLLMVLGVGLQNAEHVQRDELVGRELQELAIGRLGLAEKPLLVQLEGVPEQWQHVGFLPFPKPGILKCTLTYAVAHESIPPESPGEIKSARERIRDDGRSRRQLRTSYERRVVA
jgi:hypothetical protein